MDTDETEKSGAEEHALEEDGASGILEGLVIEFQRRISSCCPYNCIVIYNREDLRSATVTETEAQRDNPHQSILQEHSSTQDTSSDRKNHTTAAE